MRDLVQIATLRMPLKVGGVNQPLSISLDITGRENVMVDGLQANLVVEPKSDGALPNPDTVKLVERLVRLRFALDRQDRRVLTIGTVPVSAFKQLDGGPIPIPPFALGGNEQPTVKVEYPQNVLQTDPFKNYGDVYMEMILWGKGA